MSRAYDVAVAGATGLVGNAMIRILEERNFPVGTLYPLASSRSAGSSVEFRGETVRVEVLDDFNFSKTPIAFFSAGSSVSAEHVPRAVEEGAIVIDNTSYFRYDDGIPLIVPECNAERISEYSNRGIIANPNCSTIQMVVALKPIHNVAGIERINIATYQATSGAGRSEMESLTENTEASLAGAEVVVKNQRRKLV